MQKRLTITWFLSRLTIQHHTHTSVHCGSTISILTVSHNNAAVQIYIVCACIYMCGHLCEQWAYRSTRVFPTLLRMDGGVMVHWTIPPAAPSSPVLPAINSSFITPSANAAVVKEIVWSPNAGSQMERSGSTRWPRWWEDFKWQHCPLRTFCS